MRFIHCLVLLGILLAFGACKKVKVTREGIYYAEWSAGEYLGFTIAKIQLADTTLSVFDKDFNGFDNGEYTVDSSFCFHVAGTDNRTRERPIYFDRPNRGIMFGKCYDTDHKTATIGRLELNTWYVIEALGEATIGVYVDSKGDAHTFELGYPNI